MDLDLTGKKYFENSASLTLKVGPDQSKSLADIGPGLTNTNSFPPQHDEPKVGRSSVRKRAGFPLMLYYTSEGSSNLDVCVVVHCHLLHEADRSSVGQMAFRFLLLVFNASFSPKNEETEATF